MRAVRAILVVCGVVLGLAPPALADGPGVGTPTVVTLGDSAISGEAGRWAGNTNQSPSQRRRARLDRLLGHRRRGEAIPGCHRSKAAQAHIGGGVNGAQPRLLGRAHVHDRHRLGQDFKPGHRLLLRRVRPQGPGADARRSRAATRNVKAVVVMIGANNYGFGDDRRALRDQLGDLAVVVEELLQRRLGHDVALHRRAPGAGDRPTSRDALLRVREAMTDARLRRRRSTRSSPRPTGRRSRARAASATARPAGRASRVGGCGVWNRDADWAHDTVVAAMNGSVRNGAAGRGSANVVGARPPERARRPAAVRVRRRRARGDGHRELDERRARSTGRSGSPDPHRHDDLRPLPAPGGQPRRATGASWRCATACARPTTAAPSAAGAACASRTGSTRAGSRRWGCSSPEAAQPQRVERRPRRSRTPSRGRPAAGSAGRPPRAGSRRRCSRTPSRGSA